MYKYSTQFKNEIDNDHRGFLVKMTITPESGSSFVVTNSNIWKDTFSIEEATSASGAFTVGALISNKLTFSLNNADERYSNVDFIDAVINVEIGKELNDGTVEMMQYGVYNISESSFTASAVNIVALDNLSKLNRPFIASGFYFPNLAFRVVNYCCAQCGLSFDENTMPAILREYRTGRMLDAGERTCAEMMSYLAQMSCCYVKALPNGKIAFLWYEMKSLMDSVDGGTFAYDGKGEDGEPEAQLDGGSFDNGAPSYSTGDDVDGGTFRSLDGYHIVNSTLDSSIDTDDVRITGVNVFMSAENENMNDVNLTYGNEGYVISIRDNPFVLRDNVEDIAALLWDRLGNMTFRPLRATILPDPMIEAGDVARVADKNGNYYDCFISSYKLTLDNTCNFACDAESAPRKLSKVQSTAQIAVTEAVKQAKKYYYYAEQEAIDLNKLMANALGFYSTSVVQTDGSTIQYLHNKPELSNSDVQWKITSDGIAVSTDYGKTWNGGITKEGNLIANTLQAIGINADWIRAGSISGQHISGCNITGGSIDIAGAFRVSGSGMVTASNLNMTGGNIALNDAAGQGAFTISGKTGTSVSLGSTYVTISGPNGAAILTPAGLVVTSANGSSSFSNGVINLNGKRVLTQDDYASLMQTMADADTAMSGKILSMSKTIADHERRIQVLEGQLRGFIDTTFASLEKRVAALEKKIK